MNEITQEAKELINLIEKKSKIAAMLAPSFVVDFKYPEIVGMLKRLGFKFVLRGRAHKWSRSFNKKLFRQKKAKNNQSLDKRLKIPAALA
ncbi:MAG: hypothetical protein AAB361_00670 [Patescibacteria group bacterium]